MQKHQKKARLSIDCTLDERRYIKMLAAREDKTISEYLIGLARKKMPHCTRHHIPNKKTEDSIEESEAGKGVKKVDSFDNFWKSMGV